MKVKQPKLIERPLLFLYFIRSNFVFHFDRILLFYSLEFISFSFTVIQVIMLVLFDLQRIIKDNLNQYESNTQMWIQMKYQTNILI